MRNWMMIGFALLVPVVGCGGGGSSGGGGETAIVAGNLSGKIGGQSWVFGSGGTDSFLSDEKGFFTTLIAAKSYDCASGGQGTGDKLLIKIPKTPGDYPFSLQQNMTFVIDNMGNPENDATVEGHVEVKTVTATTITAGLFGTFDTGNEVNGQLTVTICPAMP